jgi:hypothetical protein
MGRAAAFKLSDVQRAVKAVKAAGLRVHAVEVAPDGTIRVLTTAPGGLGTEDPVVVAWERMHGLRPTPLETWEAEQEKDPR